MRNRRSFKILMLSLCFAVCFAIIALTGAAVAGGNEIELPTVTFDSSQGGFYGDTDYFLPGDMNGDEKTDEKDAEYFLMYLYFPEQYPIEDQKLDLNGDGFVTDADVAYLLCYLKDSDSFPIAESTVYEGDESGGRS